MFTLNPAGHKVARSTTLSKTTTYYAVAKHKNDANHNMVSKLNATPKQKIFSDRQYTWPVTGP